MKKQINLWITKAGDEYSGPLLSKYKPDFPAGSSSPWFDERDTDVAECSILNDLQLPERFVGKVRILLTERQNRTKGDK